MGRLHGDGFGVFQRLPGRAADTAFKASAHPDSRGCMANPEFRRYAAQIEAGNFNSVDLDRAAKGFRRAPRGVDFWRVEVDPVFAVGEIGLDPPDAADSLGRKVGAPWCDVDDAEVFAADVNIAGLDAGELAVTRLAVLNEVIEQATFAGGNIAADHAAHEIGLAG